MNFSHPLSLNEIKKLINNQGLGLRAFGYSHLIQNLPEPEQEDKYHNSLQLLALGMEDKDPAIPRLIERQMKRKGILLSASA